MTPFSWIDHLIRPRQQRGRDREASALAVLRLMTSSNFVGVLDREIGGLARFRILSMYMAASAEHLPIFGVTRFGVSPVSRALLLPRCGGDSNSP